MRALAKTTLLICNSFDFIVSNSSNQLYSLTALCVIFFVFDFWSQLFHSSSFFSHQRQYWNKKKQNITMEETMAMVPGTV